MCGIFGYIGDENPVDQCLKGLKRLEYRGYDSAGIAGLYEGDLHSAKTVGKLSVLEAAILKTPMPLEIAIGHTRWATHGKPCELNAHPHIDRKEDVAVVHNGIIENYQEIKQTYGFDCLSETDSEVLAHLISHFYNGDLLDAIQKTLQKVNGALAIAVVHKNHPGMIAAATRHSPLVIGRSQNAMALASDPTAFSSEDIEIAHLHNDEIAILTQQKAEIYSFELDTIKKDFVSFTVVNEEVSKGQYEHYMLKEINEQPVSIHRALEGRLNEEYGTAVLNSITFSAQEMQEVSRILILGCGTSWHAGSIGVSLFEGLSRIPAECEIASEYRYTNPIITPNTLVIAISQSGETADTIAALREVKAKGAKTLSICNNDYSTLARETDCCITLNAGPELSVCSTKAFSNQLVVLSLLALYLARIHHMGKDYGRRIIGELKRLSVQVESILQRSDEIKELAQKYAQNDRYFFLGRRYMYHASLEAALKLKEISYLDATGYPAGELKHGPIALINDSIAVVALCGNKQTFSKMLSNLQEVKARGSTLLAFAPEQFVEQLDLADDVFVMPDTADHASAVLYGVATQLFAYYIACEHGTDIDQPRNLAKSVTVE